MRPLPGHGECKGSDGRELPGGQSRVGTASLDVNRHAFGVTHAMCPTLRPKLADCRPWERKPTTEGELKGMEFPSQSCYILMSLNQRPQPSTTTDSLNCHYPPTPPHPLHPSNPDFKSHRTPGASDQQTCLNFVLTYLSVSHDTAKNMVIFYNPLFGISQR